ncbi:hypothetical protein [Kribbella speibonae]|uniref:hypothetical protein n=1 Tax=Kribbella speibonae TaxID=1572660 RepID=UPI00103BAFF4|nr:hypothetical protein [Kribbella speibonae]
MPAATAPPVPTVVPLTVAQATKAALLVSDLPKGWEGGVAPDRTPTIGLPVTYDPAECRVVRDPLRDGGTPATIIRGQYLLRADNPSDDKVVTEVIASFPADQLPLVRDIAEVLPRCGVIARTLEGLTSKTFVRQLPVPGLRDGVVLRFGDADDPTLKSDSYTAFVARGGTLLALRAGSDTFTTDAAFARFATTAVARLDAVVG